MEKKQQMMRAASKPVVESLETRTLMFAPSGMSAQGTSASSITLHWTDNCSTETHFIVDRSVDGINYKRIGSVPANSTSFPDTGLQPSTQYYYRVKAITSTVNSGWTRVTGTTLATSTNTAPVAPASLGGSSSAATTMNVTWSDKSDNETHFLLERSLDGVTFKRIASIGANTTQFIDSALAAGTQYQYRIRSVNGVGGSKWVRGSGTTYVDPPPAAPASFAAEAKGTSSITLTWTDNASNETHYLIDRSSDGVNFTRIASLGADAESYDDTGLLSGATYYYRLKAANATATSGWVHTNAKTDAPPAVITENFDGDADNFIVIDGPWALASGTYRTTADNNSPTTHLNSRVIHNTALEGDFVLTADAQAIDSGIPWNNFAVIFGYQDPENYYFFSSNQSNDGGTNGIFKVVNGTSTELADVAATITPGATYQVRVERNGSAIKAYRNGVLVASASDDAFLSGQIGLGSRQFEASFDNLTVNGTAVQPPTQPPDAPSGLSASATSSGSIALQWTDNADNEAQFEIERSTDGSTFTKIATIRSNSTSYNASGLSATTKYYFRVRATNVIGVSTYSNTANATTSAVVAGQLVSPPQAAVDAAIVAPLIRYNRYLPGGAHTDGAWNGGASITLALAAYAGNTSADARLLQQMRFTITGGNDISANGGYPAQHERHVTGMFALARLTPRIWNQLSTAEQNKVNLLMKAALVASAFTTSDNNPYIKAGQQQRALDGDTNLARDWNPNYREGMVGGVLVGAAYFGPAQAEQMLNTYNHQTFVSELAAAGLSDIYETFNWKQANPASIAPDGATIAQGVKNYLYYGIGLNNLMGIYNLLLTNTYGKHVNAGLNGGAGVNGGGKLISGAATLPNQGALGMLTEFDSVDAGGPRSAANYAYDGFRPHQMNLLVLIASGNWDAASPIAAEAAARLEIGNTDLWYKMDHGYIGYYKGAVQGNFSTAAQGATFGFIFSRSTWENVLKPYLNGMT